MFSKLIGIVVLFLLPYFVFVYEIGRANGEKHQNELYNLEAYANAVNSKDHFRIPLEERITTIKKYSAGKVSPLN